VLAAADDVPKGWLGTQVLAPTVVVDSICSEEGRWVLVCKVLDGKVLTVADKPGCAS
jgi:hypothetical protein